MRISDAFDEYATYVASVYSNRAAIQKAADSELFRLREDEAQLQQENQSITDIRGMHNYSFRTADTGEHHFYAFSKTTIDAQFHALERRTNRQYQWLLAEAYELFEDFLEKVYACAALKNKNLWPLRDFGELTFDELGSVTFEELLTQAKSKKNKPQSFLNPLREKLPRIAILETQNKLDTNLRFTITLVEKLRHHIVHTRGAVADKNKLSKELLLKVGLYNNGSPRQEYLDLIDKYVRLDGDVYFVSLLNIPLPSKGPAFVYFDKFAHLTDGLLAYAYMLTGCLTQVESK